MTPANKGTFLIYSFLLRITVAVILKSICTGEVCCLLNTSWPHQISGLILYDNNVFKDFLQRESLRRGKARTWAADPPYCTSPCGTSKSITGPKDLQPFPGKGMGGLVVTYALLGGMVTPKIRYRLAISWEVSQVRSRKGISVAQRLCLVLRNRS